MIGRDGKDSKLLMSIGERIEFVKIFQKKKIEIKLKEKKNKCFFQ